MEFMGFLRAAVQKHALGTVQTTAYIHGARLLRSTLAAKQSEDCLYLNIRTTSPSVVGEAGRRRGGDGDGDVRGEDAPPPAADGSENISPPPPPPPAPQAAEFAAADEADDNPSPPPTAAAAATAAATAPGTKLPVIVYIHGGDYHDGAGASRPFYLSNALPVRGRVVLVTFNYRLGLLGHFCHPELSKEAEAEGRPAVSGNYGILDQVSEDAGVNNNLASVYCEDTTAVVARTAECCQSSSMNQRVLSYTRIFHTIQRTAVLVPGDCLSIVTRPVTRPERVPLNA